MRTLDELNAEYSRLSMDYGDCQYKIDALKKSVERVVLEETSKMEVFFEQMVKLNEEAAQLRDEK